jgi:hypothetical protein
VSVSVCVCVCGDGVRNPCYEAKATEGSMRQTHRSHPLLANKGERGAEKHAGIGQHAAARAQLRVLVLRGRLLLLPSPCEQTYLFIR